MASKDLVVRLIGDTSKFGKALKGAEHDLSRVGAKMTKTITPAAAAVAVGMTRIGSSWNDARDAIVRGTGATGKALDDLMGSTRRVAGRVPQDFGTVGQAIADVNTRLGLTGSELEDVAKQALDFARVTGVDVSSAVRTTARAMQDWGVDASEAGDIMDMFAKASQETGIDVTRLGDTLVQFGAPLRQIGFSMEEATALLAGFEAQGVNTEAVMSGLRQSLGRMARAGEDPIETFQRVTEAIKNAGSAGEANSLALELFGSRAGPDMAAAIREGRFEIDDLVASLNDSEGTVDSASQATLRLSDRLAMLRNRVTGALGPFGEIGGAIAGVAAGAGPLIFGLGQMVPLLGKVKDGMTRFKGVIGGVSAGLVIAGAALFAFNQRQAQAAERAADLADAFGHVSRATDTEIIEDFTRLLTGMEFHFGSTQAAMDAFAESNIEGARRVLGLADAAGLTESQVEALEAAIAKQGERQRQEARTAEQYGGALDDLGDAANDAERDTRKLISAHESHAEGLRDAASATEDLTDETSRAQRAADAHRAAMERQARAMGEAADAARDKLRSVNDMADAQRAAADSTFALRREEDRFRDSIDNVNDVLNDQDADLRDVRRALDDATLSAGSLADVEVRIARETATANGEVMTASKETDIWNRSMLEAAETADGPLRDSILEYIAAVNDIPEETVTDILALIDEGKIDEAEALINETSRTRQAQIDAEANVAQADADLDAVARKNRTAIINAALGVTSLSQGTGGGGPTRFHGGTVPGSRGTPVPITAHGGEFVLDAGTVDAIRRGSPTSSAAGGGVGGGRGGVNIETVNITNGVELEQFAQRLNLHLAGVA